MIAVGNHVITDLPDRVVRAPHALGRLLRGRNELRRLNPS